MTRYFFSVSGDYLGGFDGESALALVPQDAIEVEDPPEHGLDKLIDGVIVPYVPPVSLADALEAIFISAIQDHDGLLSPEQEGDLFGLKVAITEMLKFNRLAAAKAKIEAVVLPESLESVRTAMLEKFPL